MAHKKFRLFYLRWQCSCSTELSGTRPASIGKREFLLRSLGSNRGRGLPVSWKRLGGSNGILYLGKAKLLVSTVVRRDGKGEVISNGWITGSLIHSCRLMPNAVPLTPRSRCRQISRFNRELDGGERQHCVLVSNSPLQFGIVHF